MSVEEGVKLVISAGMIWPNEGGSVKKDDEAISPKIEQKEKPTEDA